MFGLLLFFCYFFSGFQIASIRVVLYILKRHIGFGWYQLCSWTHTTFHPIHGFNGPMIFIWSTLFPNFFIVHMDMYAGMLFMLLFASFPILDQIGSSYWFRRRVAILEECVTTIGDGRRRSVCGWHDIILYEFWQQHLPVCKVPSPSQFLQFSEQRRRQFMPNNILNHLIPYPVFVLFHSWANS